jgi:antibiotic biosynthesis monooxygenase (ABM) superfamily enzyme
MSDTAGDTTTDVAVVDEDIDTPITPAAPPSVHVRAVVTWLAIFPLVSIGMLLLGPVSDSWHPILRALVLTAVVVPLAVYVVVPRLLGAYVALRQRQAARRR